MNTHIKQAIKITSFSIHGSIQTTHTHSIISKFCWRKERNLLENNKQTRTYTADRKKISHSDITVLLNSISLF